MNAALKNILVINVNWLGDVVLSAPVFSNLKKQFPSARISCMAVPRVKEILECIPDVDEVLIYDEDGRHASIFGKWSLIRSMRQYKFDAVFILHKSMTRALIARMAGIPIRVGYNTKRRGGLLTHNYDLPKTPMHRLEEYVGLLKNFGVPLKDLAVNLKVDPKGTEKAHEQLKQLGIGKADFSVIIHPAANWNLKRWPTNNFTLLIRELMSAGAKVIVTGGKEEKELAEEIVKDLDKKPHVLVGQTTIKELLALMSQVKLVISADSGPMHLASGIGADLIVLFGPTRREITGPRGRGRSEVIQYEVGCNHAPCYHLSCPDNICMQAITVEDVLNAVRKFRS